MRYYYRYHSRKVALCFKLGDGLVWPCRLNLHMHMHSDQFAMQMTETKNRADYGNSHRNEK
jgi:hypothetical protein